MKNRICIIGNGGSGKTTLAKEIGRVLEIPVYHLDRHLLKPDYDRLPEEEYLNNHQRLISEEEWIIDGNYSKVMAERVSRATLVIFLDIGRATTVPRVLRRLFIEGQSKDSIPEGAKPKHLTWWFLKWVATYNRRKWRAVVGEHCAKDNTQLLVLKKAKVGEWVEKVLETLKRS